MAQFQNIKNAVRALDRQVRRNAAKKAAKGGSNG